MPNVPAGSEQPSSVQPPGRNRRRSRHREVATDSPAAERCRGRRREVPRTRSGSARRRAASRPSRPDANVAGEQRERLGGGGPGERERGEGRREEGAAARSAGPLRAGRVIRRQSAAGAAGWKLTDRHLAVAGVLDLEELARGEAEHAGDRGRPGTSGSRCCRSAPCRCRPGARRDLVLGLGELASGARRKFSFALSSG